MATKKTTTKKIVKKPMMKKGGIKKPLRKAQNGEPVYSGPINKNEANVIDNSNMSEAAKAKARQPFLNPKNTGNNAIIESSNVMDDEYDKYYNQGVIWGNQTPKKGPYVSPYHKKGGVTKKYEAGGMTDTQTCGGPGKPKCRKKFKSKGKSQETKGSILGTLGAIAGGIGGYAAYKKLKEKKKGGATKYQKGGSAPHGPGSMTKGTVPPMVNEQAKPQKPKPQRTKSQAPAGWEDGKTAKRSTKRYQIGGMVNPNAKLQAAKSAGSKGVKSGVNPKAAASKVARGRSGGTSAAPKKATPGRK